MFDKIEKPETMSVEDLHQLFKSQDVNDDASNENLSEGKRLEKELSNEYPYLYDVYNASTLQNAFSFGEDYKNYLDEAKTEREAVKFGINLLSNLGFVDVASKERLVPGDKVYFNIHGKGLMAAVIGEESVRDGFNILGSHIDSPRFDLKPNPLFENNGMAYFKTHYYGGVKKYQWTTMPLALHGVVQRKDGTQVHFSIGEDENDPVFMFTDLLIHLSKDQLSKPASKVVEGEEFNVLVAGRPIPHKDVSTRFKLAVLQILNERYGIVERDLVSAELQIVPANKARDLGLDRSFVTGYGQDDSACSFPALRAIAAQNKVKRTAVAMLTDKEEIGSYGNTGAQSQIYENFFIELFVKTEGEYDELAFVKALENSFMISSDVSAAYDPTFSYAFESANAPHMGKGVAFSKYTGSGGKSGSNDANSEYYTKILHILDENNIPWQTGELGKVDQGGGGTIAHLQSKRGIQVIDCGVPVLSMHAPFEISHKLDMYNCYQVYVTFLQNME